MRTLYRVIAPLLLACVLLGQTAPTSSSAADSKGDRVASEHSKTPIIGGTRHPQPAPAKVEPSALTPASKSKPSPKADDLHSSVYKSRAPSGQAKTASKVEDAKNAGAMFSFFVGEGRGGTLSGVSADQAFIFAYTVLFLIAGLGFTHFFFARKAAKQKVDKQAASERKKSAISLAAASCAISALIGVRFGIWIAARNVAPSPNTRTAVSDVLKDCGSKPALINAESSGIVRDKNLETSAQKGAPLRAESQANNIVTIETTLKGMQGQLQHLAAAQNASGATNKSQVDTDTSRLLRDKDIEIAALKGAQRRDEWQANSSVQIITTLKDMQGQLQWLSTTKSPAAVGESNTLKPLPQGQPIISSAIWPLLFVSLLGTAAWMTYFRFRNRGSRKKAIVKIGNVTIETENIDWDRRSITELFLQLPRSPE
jgi:hypothetical protein